MGFSISWVAFRGLGKKEVLGRAGFREFENAPTMQGFPTSLFSVAEIPTGWTIVFTNFAYASPERLAALSKDAVVIGVQVEEHVMFSAARCYTDSRETWSVCHDGQLGLYDLETRGVPPAALDKIKIRLSAEQARGDGLMMKSVQPDHFLAKILGHLGTVSQFADDGDRWMATDYIFDVPVELAAELTGYRHVGGEFEWGQPNFTKIEPLD